MNIKEYQEQAKRTCVDLGEEKNRQHMLMGIISEIGEITDAYKKELAYGKQFDRVNLKEECSDVSWYIVNWATFNNIDLINPTSNARMLSWIAEDVSNCEVDYLIDFIFIGLDLSKPQLMLDRWYTICIKLGLSDEEFYQGLSNNINKLKVRFPDKFTNEAALNRNLDAERTQLEK